MRICLGEASGGVHSAWSGGLLSPSYISIRVIKKASSSYSKPLFVFLIPSADLAILSQRCEVGGDKNDTFRTRDNAISTRDEKASQRH